MRTDGWKVDLHLPDRRYERGFEGDAFISADRSALSDAVLDSLPLPLLAQRANLFMAGRCISVTHEAWARCA
jgi:hypothetical protein